MKINVEIKENKIISWQKIPLDYNKPIIEVENTDIIHLNISEAINPIIKTTQIKKDIFNEETKKTDRVEKSITYTEYEFIENIDEYNNSIEQIKIINQKKQYETLVKKYMREIYPSAEDELAILFRGTDEEYSKHEQCLQECKEKARKEIYGE